MEDSGHLWRTVATCGGQWPHMSRTVVFVEDSGYLCSTVAIPEEGQQATCGGQWLPEEDRGYYT